MAYDKEIRFRCRALFEVLDKSLSDIAKDENVAISTLSDWKNDDRVEYGGIWLKGCKAGKVDETSKQLRKELEATSVYDEMKKKLESFYGVSKKGELEADGTLSIGSDNATLQARAETDISLLASVQADYFDAQMFKNSMLSSIVLNNQVKKDVTKIKQADIKASSEIHKLAKESRFGKNPDTVIVNANGVYSPEELKNMSIEELERLYYEEQKKLAIPAVEKVG